jgi:hypothetical protein
MKTNDKNVSRLLMYSCFDRLVIKFLSSQSLQNQGERNCDGIDDKKER